MISNGTLRLITNSSLRNEIIKHYTRFEQMKEKYLTDVEWKQSFTRELDIQTSLITYDPFVNDLFENSPFLDYSDLSFFNDANSDRFGLLLNTIAARIWSMRQQEKRIIPLISSTKNLSELIKDELAQK